jgi:prepilin-type N-terminal cleavage/methylation domain-containing protein
MTDFKTSIPAAAEAADRAGENCAYDETAPKIWDELAAIAESEPHQAVESGDHGLTGLGHAVAGAEKSMKQHGFTLIEAATVVAIIGILIASLVWQAYTCERQAKLMNMRHDWGVVQGCMIEPKPGQWVPMKNYRVL